MIVAQQPRGVNLLNQVEGRLLWWACNDCGHVFQMVEFGDEPSGGWSCDECGKHNLCWQSCCVGDLNAH